MSSQEIFRFAVTRQPDTKKRNYRHIIGVPKPEEIPDYTTGLGLLPDNPLNLLAASKQLSRFQKTNYLKGFNDYKSGQEFISVLSLVPHASFLLNLIRFINESYEFDANRNKKFKTIINTFKPANGTTHIKTEQIYKEWEDEHLYERLGISIIIQKYIKPIERSLDLNFNSKLWENRPLAQLSQLYTFYECIRRIYDDNYENYSNDLTLQEAIKIINAPIVIPEEIQLLFPPRLRPSGTTDLLIVKKHLIKYTGGEVAHIENVLASEKRSREHSRLVESETIFEEERETETTEERELETTEKEEMERTASEVINENTSFSAGVNATYKYGEMLEVNAHADFAYDKSVENSVETSKSYTKEVIEKSVSKIRQKTVNKMKKRMLQTVEEKNLHEFNNIGTGTVNITGIYQWQNKTYQAEIWNYGLREMYDIMLPDPSRYLKEIFSSIPTKKDKNIPLDIPPLSSITINKLEQEIDIKDDYKLIKDYSAKEGSMFFEFYTTAFGATDIKPPPENEIYLTLNSSVSQPDLNIRKEENVHSTLKDTVEIPDGYKTESVVISVLQNNNLTNNNHPVVSVAVGDIRVLSHIELLNQVSVEENDLPDGKYLFSTFSNTNTNKDYEEDQGTTEEMTLEGITGTLHVSIIADHFSVVAVHLYIKCKATVQNLEQWRLETFTQLSFRYQELLEKHESKTDFEEEPPKKDLQTLAKMNPQLLKKRIEDEIKRLCIEKLMGKQSGGVDGYEGEENSDDSVSSDEPKVPELKSTNTNADYEDYEKVVRFLQHAFEWTNMTYLFYPYYWDKKENWLEKLVNHYQDTEFDDFAKSGFTRVRLPVRPGFQLAVNHYLTTDETYFGQPLPNIGDELHLPFIDEQKESLGAPTDEVPWPPEDPITWDFEVPTDLVLLRDKLPEWEKKGDKWLEKHS